MASAVTNLFDSAVRNCSDECIKDHLMKAWNENPERLLKTICMIRDPRNGKGERDIAYKLMGVLKLNFPKTYQLNVKRIARDYGRLEDLLVYAKLESGGGDDDFEMKIFAEMLMEDMKAGGRSLAAKWAPREKGHYGDMAVRLAKILFPGDAKCLERYRKDVLRPLAERGGIVERQMCAGKWAEIEYASVPVQAMKVYGKEKGAFLRHDRDRFEAFRRTKSGESVVNSLERYDVMIDETEKEYRFVFPEQDLDAEYTIL